MLHHRIGELFNALTFANAKTRHWTYSFDNESVQKNFTETKNALLFDKFKLKHNQNQNETDLQ